MRALLCGFALGVWAWQQSAELLAPSVWWAYVGLVCLIGSAAHILHKKRNRLATWLVRHIPQGAQQIAELRLVELSVCGLTILATLVTGYSYAAWRAKVRLAYQLPVALERHDLQLTGVIVALPTVQERVTRFILAVEKNPIQTKDKGQGCLSKQCTDETNGWADRYATTTADGQKFPTLIQLNWYAEPGMSAPRLQVGERWALTVRLARVHGLANPYGSDVEAAMLGRNLRALGYVRAQPAPRYLGTVNSLALSVQRWRAMVRERIAEVLPQAPHVGVITALAMGWQAGITAQDWQLFTRTGTNHLVAISGLHISLVAGFATAWAGWLWRQTAWVKPRSLLWLAAPRMAALVGVSVGAAYAVLAGLGVPAQRALIMLAVAIGASLTAREIGTSVTLAWALALVLWINPWAVLSAGFWLSFGAVAIILAVAQTQRKLWQGDLQNLCQPQKTTLLQDCMRVQQANLTRWGFFKSPLNRIKAWLAMRCATLFKLGAAAAQVQGAVTLGLMPLTALWFTQTSLISPLANAFAIPWVSFLVTPLVLLGIILPAPLDAWAFQIAHLSFVPLAYLLAKCAALRWAVWPLPAPTLAGLLLAMLGVATWVWPCQWRWRIAALLLFLPLLVPAQRAPALGEFRLTVLDVGQGAATLVETAQHRLLFDTGPSYGTASDAGQHVILPYLRAIGINGLDMLVVSHADSDHEGGAQTLFKTLPSAQLRASLPASHPLWQAAQAETDTARCQAGESWVWDGIKFTMLWPDKPLLQGVRNPGSCVLRIENSQHAALLTGDIEAAQEHELVKWAPLLLPATVLIAPHHGSRTSSTERFLDAVAPREAVFQVGYRNRFHHPHPQILARYQAHGITLHRSDRDGAITFETRHAQLKVKRYRTVHRRYWMESQWDMP